MLPDTPDVERVLTGPDGVLSALQNGAIVIDMSSISPVATERLAMAVAEKGASMLDAPVSGGEIGAINASLSIMVGGDEAAFDAREADPRSAWATPRRIVHIGESGAGQVCKVCNQVAIGGALAGVSEAFALAKKAGVDAGARAAGAARRLRGEPRARSPRRADAQRQLQAGLPHEALSEGSAAGERSGGANGVAMPGTAIVTQLVNALVASGGGDLDYAAIGDGAVSSWPGCELSEIRHRRMGAR